MKKKIGIRLMVVLMLLQAVWLSGCAQTGSETAGTNETLPAPRTPSTVETEEKDETAEQDGINAFAFRMTAAFLDQQEDESNRILSPFSAWLPLAALTNAADEKAEQTLLQALGMSDFDPAALNETVRLLLYSMQQGENAEWAKENDVDFESPIKIANALFLGKGVVGNADFETLFSDVYQGKVFETDFADPGAVKEVNDWASEQTEGKIQDLIEEFDPQTVAAIANAVFFSDCWAEPFSEEDTADDVFYGNKEETVPFMNHKFDSLRYYEEDRFAAVVLPTANGGSLVLLLPDEGVAPEEILSGMDAQRCAAIFDSQAVPVRLSLPRFTIESDSLSLLETLEQLQVPLLDPHHPHLDGLAENERLFLSQAIQKAMIEVDEKGMTAAAATVMGMVKMSLPPDQEPVTFCCNRPFAFFLTADGKEAGPVVVFTGVVHTVRD